LFSLSSILKYILKQLKASAPIIYSPDNTYSITDGHWGTCWVADILDSGNEDNCYNIYHRFRNFMDLIEIYNIKGYKFIEE